MPLFSKSFFINFYNFFQIFVFIISWGEIKNKVTSWRWPTGVGCSLPVLIKATFFLSLFLSVSMGFFIISFSKNIIGREVGKGGRVIQEHECPKESLKLSLPKSFQNLISIFKSNPADFGRSRVMRV
jgi:hypothetical protein